MKYIATTATYKLAALRRRIRAVPGGTSAGKTISILQLLADDAMTDDEPTLTSVVSETFPHLKRGAMRDFINILQSHGYWDDKRWNKTDYIYTFPRVVQIDDDKWKVLPREHGSKLEFFSADQPSKVRGPRRDRLFVNEGNNIAYEAWDQMLVRTKEYAFVDWNPTNEFWFYTNVLHQRDDIDFITLTYKDNEALDPNIIADIESHRANKNWWRVYGEGKLGELEAQIFRNWRQIPEIPHEARLERYGMDFGYTNHPSAIVGIYRYNGAWIIDEVLYKKGQSNRQLADVFLNQPQALVIADSAEPKSIDEIKSYGVNIIGAQKGQGSILQGIQNVQEQQIFVTTRSLNVIHEQRNYLWQSEKDNPERFINIPEPGFDHSMDAIRYGMESLTRARAKPKKPKRVREYDPMTGRLLS